MNLAVSLLVLVILVLLNSPVLDSMRISVNSHMARYQSGKNTPDQVSLYMLEQSGRYGRAALESLKSDAEYMKDPKTRAGSADGVRWRATSSGTGIGKSISR
ncbi:inner membrane protein [Escherichia coli]|uniref:Inner membrane protein n=1 Tax=Escherichia coli TaxID=562 RepID=A0A377K0T3_ECOLX|nr:inner membrane protein [Escherichia coli]